MNQIYHKQICINANVGEGGKALPMVAFPCPIIVKEKTDKGGGKGADSAFTISLAKVRVVDSSLSPPHIHNYRTFIQKRKEEENMQIVGVEGG
jgi:hypothetical protein